MCLNIEIMIDQFEKYLNNVYLVANYVKLHGFKYRLLVWVLVMDQQLKKWKIKYMLFCKTEVDTILPLFWECIQVQELWQNLFNECSIDSFQLTLKNISFSMVHCNAKHVFNHIVLITKYYI